MMEKKFGCMWHNPIQSFSVTTRPRPLLTAIALNIPHMDVLTVTTFWLVGMKFARCCIYIDACFLCGCGMCVSAAGGHVTCRQPMRREWSVSGIEAGFRVFLHGVFYVGKGKRSRPYEHFKEAVTYYRQTVRRKVIDRYLWYSPVNDSFCCR